MPNMNNELVTIAPAMEAFTSTYCPARSAASAMINSVRFPSVALSRPPTISPVLAATDSVARLSNAAKGRRDVDYATEGVHEAVVYDGALLEPGMTLAGPAIIETSGSTVVVHPANEAVVDNYGNLVISITLDGSEDGDG